MAAEKQRRVGDKSGGHIVTDQELQDFIEHGENGFVEFAMVFGEGWAKHAIDIAKELRARLAQPKRKWKGLTRKERSELWWSIDMGGMPEHDYGKAIEAMLREKNADK
jgi:hypothetical protein